MVKDKFKFLSFAPVVFLSAKTGERTRTKFIRADRSGGGGTRRKIATPELNRWLKEDVDLQRATNPKARPVRIYYMTQAKVAPPVFLLFTNQKKPLHFNFERFLENQLRTRWPFVGTPVRFIQRLKKRGGSRDERRRKNEQAEGKARELACLPLFSPRMEEFCAGQRRSSPRWNDEQRGDNPGYR